ncbi:MAG: hypothetical protein ACRDZ3_10075 [Acidimicrobiia bacterium]
MARLVLDHGQPVVVVDVYGQPFARLVVTVPDAEAEAGRLRAELGVAAS